jgi:hypothetical protein
MDTALSELNPLLVVTIEIPKCNFLVINPSPSSNNVSLPIFRAHFLSLASEIYIQTTEKFSEFTISKWAVQTMNIFQSVVVSNLK